MHANADQISVCNYAEWNFLAWDAKCEWFVVACLFLIKMANIFSMYRKSQNVTHAITPTSARAKVHLSPSIMVVLRSVTNAYEHARTGWRKYFLQTAHWAFLLSPNRSFMLKTTISGRKMHASLYLWCDDILKRNKNCSPPLFLRGVHMLMSWKLCMLMETGSQWKLLCPYQWWLQ